MNRLCKNFKKSAAAYLDGELSTAEAAVFDRHLQACSGCREEAEQLRRSVQLLEHWPAIAPSEDYDRAFWAKLETLQAEQAARRAPVSRDGFLQWLLRPGPALSAAAAMAVCLFALTFFTPDSRRKELTAAPDMDLLLNMEVIENSEALEHFEIISLLDVLEQELEG